MSKFDKTKSDKPRRAAAPRGDYNDPYKRAQRPARAPAPRTGTATARPRRDDGAAGAPRPRRDDAAGYAPRPRRDAAAGYTPRPRRDDAAGYTPRPRRDDAAGYVPRGRSDEDGAGRPARGFTVTLDPDVARVFRGDASVNKALRLVLQLMQVVQGPPPRFGARNTGEAPASRAPARSGYQGTDEARGFKRKPRFAADDE